MILGVEPAKLLQCNHETCRIGCNSCPAWLFGGYSGMLTQIGSLLDHALQKTSLWLSKASIYRLVWKAITAQAGERKACRVDKIKKDGFWCVLCTVCDRTEDILKSINYYYCVPCATSNLGVRERFHTPVILLVLDTYRALCEALCQTQRMVAKQFFSSMYVSWERLLIWAD